MKMQTYMGIEIPRNTKEALYLDKKNKDRLWKKAIRKEIDGIRGHATFQFLPPGVKPPEGHQEAPLRIIFDILNVIAQAQGLNVLAGDVGNAYLNADTKEKVYGPELEGRIAIIKKSLYGLKSSSAQWHAHFAKTLYTMGFQPTLFDNDVWIKKRTGVSYVGNPKGNWGINAKEYIKEGIRQIEKRLDIMIREEKMPMKTSDHPEEDETPVLDNEMHREYQSLMGKLQWLVTLDRINICYAVSLLSRFCPCPREGHLTRALRVWGYLKKYPCQTLSIKSEKFSVEGEQLDCSLIDFVGQYKYAQEEIDPKFPKPMGPELDVWIFFDSDHAHDKVTGRSISGVIVLVGSTPIIWKSKRHGAVQTSTYGAELSAMRLATEEAITTQ